MTQNGADLRRVWNKISQFASQDGFMMAFQEKDGSTIGFSFLVSKDQKWLALYGVARELGEPFELSSEYHKGSYVDEKFLERHFDKFSELSGITKDTLLLDAFSEKSHIWKFVSFLNKRFGGVENNRWWWRILWGRIIEMIGHDRLVIEDSVFKKFAFTVEASDMKRLLIRKLREHAIDGQIVILS